MSNTKETYTLIFHWKGHRDQIRKGLDRLNASILPAELKMAYPKHFEKGLMSVEILKEVEE